MCDLKYMVKKTHTLYSKSCMYVYKHNNFICQKIKSMTRHLKYSYISIFTNLLLTHNETKSVKPIQPYQLKKN